ncbi:hypothetical protein INS49_006116 [Diaporthe citri]|uniref:uncharacterized protein n=1 Tax=Diaporthe citri TaxID=83186 RepID=UPI001C81A30E|nr:uncharacterized protein INS49_006116 [Diaporthe citri]KAG6364515.1 hypothetical protein INS49_006116 [Diaporthe citri]
MGNILFRLLNLRAPREICHDDGGGCYENIISKPLVAPAAEAPSIKGLRRITFGRKSTQPGSRRVIGGYPKNYHW